MAATQTRGIGTSSAPSVNAVEKDIGGTCFVGISGICVDRCPSHALTSGTSPCKRMSEHILVGSICPPAEEATPELHGSIDEKIKPATPPIRQPPADRKHEDG